MKKIKYPLLYYRLNEDAILGILVGTELQYVEKDIKNIKTTFRDFLQKQYKKQNDYPFMDIIDAKLKIINVKIRPTYRESTASYPTAHVLNVPVPVVYGETEEGFYECHLPLIQESFIYYDPKQFSALVQHICTVLLNQQSPEKIYRLLSHDQPQLDMVELKVNEDRDYNWGNANYQRSYKTLSRLATKYPYPKAVRKNISAFPDAAWELENRVEELIDKIINTRANVLIVGDSGVGKSAIIKQAIRKLNLISKKQKFDLTFWQLMAQRITSGSKYLGQWEEVCEQMMEDLNATNGILWVVDFVQLLMTGGRGPEDSVAAFLISFLQEGRLQIIGEVSKSELESMRRLLPGFVENFQVIEVNELREEKIQIIIDKFAAFCDKNLKVHISKNALALSYRLLLRYYPYESFPGKAIKFLGTCVNEAQLSNKEKINVKNVIQNFIKQTGLPELFLRDDIFLDQKELTHYFQQKIIGQESAIDKMSQVVKIFKAGLNNPNKPISTLIFAGPTGVGKTASAKALADYFFGKGQQQSPLIRIDMSEFQFSWQIDRLIGSDGEVGTLIKEVREKPFSVLLLDEVEKAAPAIFDALLTVLDEGILVDAFGRLTNFRNTIIIMTTNLGSSNRQSIGFGDSTDDSTKYESAIASFFRPEFVNRIDGVVMFNALSEKDVFEIAQKELNELKNREGFAKRKLKIEFSDRVLKFVASVGFDERYGARPLQRAIEQHLVSPMASWLLQYPKIENKKLKIDYDQELIIVAG